LTTHKKEKKKGKIQKETYKEKGGVGNSSLVTAIYEH
jgi:hypothetical protein